MFDRFTDAAKQAISRSRRETLRLQHDAIDVGHMLLGLMRQPSLEVEAALADGGVAAARLVLAIEALMPLGNAAPPGQLPFTGAAKQALQKAMETAAELGDAWIGADHLLLGAIAAAPRSIADAIAGTCMQYELLRRTFATAEPAAATTPAPEPAPATPGTAFRVADALAQLAEIERLLRASTDAAATAQQFDAAAVLRDLLYRCKQASELLRRLPAAT